MSSAVARAREPALPGVRFARVVDDTQLSVGYSLGYGITHVTAGAFDFAYRKRIATQSPGIIKIKQPGELHRDLRVHAPVTGWSLNLAPELIEHARPLHLARSLVAPAPRLLALGAMLARGGRERLELDQAVAWAVDALAAHAERPPAREPGDAPVARRMRDKIAAHWRDALSLADLADAGGADRFHALRAFVAEYGVPPYRYLTHVRIAHARRLLERGVAPAQAAVDVGFYDQSQLHRHFKRHLGVTPGAYARAAISPKRARPTRR